MSASPHTERGGTRAATGAGAATVRSESLRENSIADAFVALSGKPGPGLEVLEAAELLVSVCVELLSAASATAAVLDLAGVLSIHASSDEPARQLGLVEGQQGAGPVSYCVQTGTWVYCGDLAAQATRWPDYVAATLLAGYRSVLTVPLRAQGQTIGALSLLGHGLGGEATQLHLAQALADVTTVSILNQRAARRESAIAGELQRALTNRIIIEQAKGMLAERDGVSVDAAFHVLRRYSRNHNRKLAEVAAAVVAGALFIPHADAPARDAAGPPAAPQYNGSPGR